MRWWRPRRAPLPLAALISAARAALLCDREDEAVALAIAIGRRVRDEPPVVVDNVVVW